ncbi:head-tail connector protein [Brevundimonas sanguinis]|uniref:head-tail connector protein n=1 Tax=Brevundimonas sanguinis TaxID=3021811 RepID=UPI0024155014|nr:head-tail connector protein [Brevundimonas sp. NCCP 15609]
MLNVVVLTAGPLFDLAEAKQHLRIDHSDDDSLIESYADAAVLSCLDFCDRKLVPQGAEPAFKAAALLTMAGLYNSRESIIIGAIVALNPAVENLLRPYRIIRV